MVQLDPKPFVSLMVCGVIHSWWLRLNLWKGFGRVNLGARLVASDAATRL